MDISIFQLLHHVSMNVCAIKKELYQVLFVMLTMEHANAKNLSLDDSVILVFMDIMVFLIAKNVDVIVWAQSMKLVLTKLDVVIAKKISSITNVTVAGKD